MKTVLFVILTAAITNNYVLVKFLGICPFLGVSKKLDQATGMSIAVIFVEVLATAVTWPIYHLLLAGKVDFTYMETVVFILVIAALVQLVEIVLKRYIPSLHKALGVYLPLITTNCGVLGVTMNNISDGLNYVDSLLTALGCGLGFFLAWRMRSRPRASRVCPLRWFRLRSSRCRSSASRAFWTGCSAVREGYAMSEILIPVLAVTMIGLICGVGLAVASHVMAVKEDERFPAIRECLPGANCGACGFTGCDGYAKALLTPGTKTNLCVPGGAEAARKLAAVLGVEAEAVEAKTALVRCGGDCDHTSPKEDYRGIASCQAAKLFFGGSGTCTYGCMGLGDCMRVCPHGAISLVKGIASVDASICVGCGICAKTCPQQVIAIVPSRAKTAVLCSNPDMGAVPRKACSAGCIGCMKCVKTCEHDAVHVDGNLASVDYDKCIGCGACAQACPTGALHELVPAAAAKSC